VPDNGSLRYEEQCNGTNGVNKVEERISVTKDKVEKLLDLDSSKNISNHNYII
jgi:hypothetical protein